MSEKRRGAPTSDLSGHSELPLKKACTEDSSYDVGINAKEESIPKDKNLIDENTRGRIMINCTISSLTMEIDYSMSSLNSLSSLGSKLTATSSGLLTLQTSTGNNSLIDSKYIFASACIYL